MTDFEEQLKQLKLKQEQLKAQQQKLIAKHNEKEKKDQLNRRIAIGEAVESITELKIQNLEAFKTYIVEHVDDIKRTQSY